MSRTFHPSKKKPKPEAIAAAPPLSTRVRAPGEPAVICNLCDQPSEQLGAWRECDEKDIPITGNAALVFVGKDHPACLRELKEHPRLYLESAGMPGYFPELCGPCTYRDGWRCMHPDLKANGGAGLLVTPNIGMNVIICPPPKPARHWVYCRGFVKG